MAQDVMKIFYYLIAHKNPQQLKLLVDSLKNNKDIICIHIDRRVDINEFKNVIPETENVYFLKQRENVYWAGWSQVKTTIIGLKKFVDSNCDYFVPLSGQDFPIKKLSDFRFFLEKNRNKNFITFSNCERDWQGALVRVKVYYFIDFFEKIRSKLKIIARVLHVIERVLNKSQLFLNVNRKLPSGYVLYGGSSWFNINHESAKIVLKEIENNKQLVNHFKYTVCSDEHFFYTIISKTKIVDTVIQNNLRYINFLPGKSNPEIISSMEVLSLPKNDFYFARKFDYELDSFSLDELYNFINESK